MQVMQGGEVTRRIIRAIPSDKPDLYRFDDTDCYLRKSDGLYVVYENNFDNKYLTFSADTPLETIEIAFTYWLTGYKDGYDAGWAKGKVAINN